MIFTDLDGTLLDHASYSYSDASEALSLIEAKGIPLIFATSKTAAEIEPLRDEMGLRTPAIVENGAGVAWPGEVSEGRGDYATIRAVLADTPASLSGLYRGFGDMSVREIAELTGLSKTSAELARRRCHSEPGIFSGDEDRRRDFLNWLSKHGLGAAQGGRFLTISYGATKADGLSVIVDWHERERERSAHPTLALGDAPNDTALLEAADFGVIVANRAHPPLPTLAGEATGRISRTTEEGPRGWNAAVLAFIERQHGEAEGPVQ